MKKLLQPLPLALLTLILFSGLGLIYWKSEAYSASTQTRISEDLRQLEALDAEWNLDVWRAKDGVTRDYDKLSSPQEKLVKLQSEISGELSRINDPVLNKAESDLKAMITKKLNLVESFKSQNSVLMNSLKFIPTANFELQQLIADERFKNPNKAKSYVPLSELTDTLLTDTLKYNLSPEADTKSNVELGISFIESIQPTYSDAIVEQVDGLLAHARTILRQKEREDALLKDISALNAAQQTKVIDTILNREYRGQMAQQQSYRNYLFIYAGLLLLLLGFVGYKMLQSVSAANKANESLNTANKWLDEMVKVRDEMVELATDELKETQVQMVQSEKMASIGQMVAGVTHEINTPLAYVKSGLEISRTRINDIAELINEAVVLNTMLHGGDTEDGILAAQLQRVGAIASTLTEEDMANELDNLLKDGLHGINQISEIVAGLKNFSRLDRQKIASFDVHEGIENTLKIAKNVVKHKSIIKQFGVDISPITCSPSSINQVFLNLISNAAQATGDDGEIKIITSQQDHNVKIEIIDNGTGMAPEVLNHIFQPFFTTKKVGEGTGLGLSIVQRIVREHGGEIKVQSKLGLGTKFTVLLPVEMSTQQSHEEALA
jgi:two-component system NtrC family sensor kinase